MNNFSFSFWLIVLSIIILATACNDPCDGSSNDEVGGEFFTVEYRDPSGANYLTSTYNPNGIIVFLDTAGGESPNPKYELVSPGYENGKFGPFYFTERFIKATNDEVNSVLLFQNEYKFDYFIKKDTFGQDTLSVHFLVSVDECSYNWASIRYSLNGDPLPDYVDQRQAEIVIVE